MYDHPADCPAPATVVSYAVPQPNISKPSISKPRSDKPSSSKPVATVQRAGADPRPPSLEARIYAVYAKLPPAEKRLADVMLAHQMNLPAFTAGELAAKAQVSKATAARLVKALGYATYPSAKRQIRADRNWGSPRADPADPHDPPPAAVSLRRMMDADTENIRRTCQAIPDQTVADITRALVAARRLLIMGLRSGYGLAHHAAHYFTLIKDDVRVLPGGATGHAHDVASFAPGDVLLVTAFRRRPRLLPTILAEARAAGATTVLITDLSANQSAAAAHYVLRCHCQSPAPFNSFAAAVTLINTLAWSVATALGEHSLARFRRIDRLVNLLDDVSTPATTVPAGRSP